MATLVFRFSSWVHDSILIGLLYWWPWSYKVRLTLYDTDWHYYKERMLFTVMALYFGLMVMYKIMGVMDKHLDLKIKKATLKAKEEMANYIKTKTQKLNES